MIHKRYLANNNKTIEMSLSNQKISMMNKKNKVRNKIDTNKNLKFACKIQMKSQI